MSIYPSVFTGTAISADVPCVTYEDVINYIINGTAAGDLICATQAEVEAKLLLAISHIEAVTSTIFCPFTGCLKIKATGTKEIFFNLENISLLELASNNPIIYAGCDANDSYCLPKTVDNHGDWIESCDGCFPCAELSICGTWGNYAEMPPMVKEVIILLTLEYLSPGIGNIQSNRQLVDSITWSDFSLNYRTTDVDFAALSTGYPYLDQMLQPYIPTKTQISMFAIGDDEGCTCRSCGKIVKGSGSCSGPSCGCKTC